MGLLSDNTDSPKQELFSQALAIWSRWSEKVIHEPGEQDKDELLEVSKILGTVSNLKCLTVELLNDFFEAKSLSLLRIQSLHLLLRIQSHLTNNLDIIIPLYASLAVQYLRLGYTGKAGTLFAQGLKQMQNSSASASTQMQWHIHYSEYYARIGVIAKAKTHISQAGEIYTQAFSSPKKRIDPKERAQRVLAVGRAGYVLSVIAFEENELEKAIGYVDYSIRVLKAGIASVERSTRPAKSSSPDFDPFSSEKKPAIEEPKAENKNVQFEVKLWAYKSVYPFILKLNTGILHSFTTTWDPSGFPRLCPRSRVLVPSSLQRCKIHQGA
jgi:tetratricopeptide (TPR) repeat protein